MNAEATGPKKKKNDLLGPVYVGYRLWAATVYGQLPSMGNSLVLKIAIAVWTVGTNVHNQHAF
ncbi:MAG: hypothetical protein MK179_04320 [Pirellulaceae bacterium]|nr:hypothetical protein [Pirellulaceae bacterium]